MNKLPITSEHLVIAQRIVSFIQEQGWDIDNIEISRYDDDDRPIVGKDAADAWKGKKWKWALRIQTAPRDGDEVAVGVRSKVAD